MSKKEPIFLVTGAAGQARPTRRRNPLEAIPASRIRASARRPESLQEFAGLGGDVRAAEYEQPATLDAAFADADRILLISGSEVGKREPQHLNVIAAANRAGAGFDAYTEHPKSGHDGNETGRRASRYRTRARTLRHPIRLAAQRLVF